VSDSSAHRVRGFIAAALAWAGAACSVQGQDIGPPISDLTRGQAETLWKSYVAPDVGLPALAPVWPARVERDGVSAVVVDQRLPILKPRGRQVQRDQDPADESLDRAYARELLENFSIDQLRPLGDDLRVHFEGKNAFVMDVTLEIAGKPVSRSLQHDGVMALCVMTLTPRTSPDGGDTKHELQRTWFSLFMPLAENDAVLGVPVTRGVVLLMPGLFATPEGTLDRLTTSLRKRGLAVLRMWAQPSRFTQTLEFDITPADGLDDDAGRIASALDDRVAECAYAAKAAFAHIEKSRPELASVPSAVIGFSGGAMTLPTVVALEPERYAAAVMVGGGACFWQMNETSNYRTMIDAVRAKWPEGSKTDALTQELRTLVLSRSPLDSFHTAAVLRKAGMEILVIQAILDEAVPAPLGDALWERLGKPPRLLLEAGHETLFMQLPRHFDAMHTTINKGFEKVAASAPEEVAPR
jgi:hypothetical protein